MTTWRHELAPGGHLLWLTGPDGAVQQIRLSDPGYTVTRSTGGTHCLSGAGPHPARDTSTLLELLAGALTVPCGDSLDFAIALDWFNIVVDGAVADLTELAALVHRAKHLYTPLGDAQNLTATAQAVADEIADFVGAHPLFRDVDAIAAPPGHDPAVPSFGARVAARVAKRRELPLVALTAPEAARPPIRGIAFSDRTGLLAGQFQCRELLFGRRVLIVDDVYASGATAQEAARALRAAGAGQVASISAIRTMEFDPAQVTKQYAQESLRADRALARATPRVQEAER